MFDDGTDLFAGRGQPAAAPPSPAPAAAYGAPTAPRATPQPPPAGGAAYGAPPLDSTARLIAINRKRERKRWLVIGGAAAGASLLLLVIVLAAAGGGGNQDASAATTPAARTPPPAPAATPAPAARPAAAATTPRRPAVEASPPAVATTEPPDEPAADPNAPPVAGTGPCRVTVTSSPAGSMVSIDNQAYGPSPITIDGPCAKRRVTVKHPRYALGTRWVTLAADRPANVNLSLARPTHTLTVTSVPPGATVSIAGRRAGTTPTAVKVMGFTSVPVTVEKRGYKTVTQKLYSKVDSARITVKLVRGR